MAELTVKGKKFSEEEIAKALEEMSKIKARAAKEKEARKAMTADQKEALKVKDKLRQAKIKMQVLFAVKGGYNPTEPEVMKWAKEQKIVA